MADEAAVTLTANDNISAPVMRAMGSLQAFQRSIDELGRASKSLLPTTVSTASSLDLAGRASATSTVSHRSAHQAVNLLSHAMAELAGVSPAAASGMRIVDGILFQMVTNAGKLSLGVVGITAVIIGLGSAMASAAESTKKQNEAMEAMSKKAEEASISADKLTLAQKRMAAIGFSDSAKEVTKLTADLSEAEAELRRLSSSFTVTGEAIGEFDQTVTVTRTGVTGTSAEIANQERTVRSLSVALEEAKKKREAFQLASIGIGAKQREEISPQGAADKEIAEIAARGAMWANYYKQTDDMRKRDLEEENNAWLRKAEVARANLEAVRDSTVSNMAVVAQAMGRAAATGANMFTAMANAMIDAMMNVAMEIVMKYMIMTNAAILFDSAAKGGLPGFLLGLAAMGVVTAAFTALKGAIAEKPKPMTSSFAPSAGIGGTESTGASGAGGATVSPSKQGNVNYISVNLGVEALELSAISDTQLKNLAGRVGRIISDSAYTGQISFAGA